MNAATIPIGTLICDLSEKGVKLSVISGDLKVDAPKGKVTSNILGVLKDRKPEIIKELQSPKDAIQFGKLADPYSSAKLPNRIHIEEAVRLYNERGWVKVWSTYLNAPIYLTKHRSTQVPDLSLPKYTQAEVKALKGLSLDELKTLHEAKVLFGGTIHEKETIR
jgi:hypothetical protein